MGDELQNSDYQYKEFVKISTKKELPEAKKAPQEILLDPSIKLDAQPERPGALPGKPNTILLPVKTPKCKKKCKAACKQLESKKAANPGAFPKNCTRKKKNSKRKPQKGCRCSKSKCLRLHCVCFRNGTFCGKDCGCKGCYNTEANHHLVDEVRKATKDINSQAFESRFVEVEVKGKKMRFTKGCSCSKNNCQKNYCECFKNGLPCTPLCKCENCCNDKCDIEPKMASKLFKKSSRKKKKIVFKTKSDNDIEMTEEILISKHKN